VLAHYVDGKLEGWQRRYWWHNGNVQSETKCETNLRNGFFNMYYESGKLEIQAKYVNDTLVWDIRYKENGELEQIEIFENGKKRIYK
jgi:antitoxin component YwqK of YwqJK toxin-antitoxin module